ncbi:hypothetical protein HMI51_13900, partial [Corallococcus coralloides]|nr:hypothetical protein [Corallococcus coralloides]
MARVWGLVALALCMALGFVAVRVWKQRGSGPDTPALWLTDATHRPLEVRLSLPAADGYRPHAPPRRDVLA